MSIEYYRILPSGFAPGKIVSNCFAGVFFIDFKIFLDLSFVMASISASEGFPKAVIINSIWFLAINIQQKIINQFNCQFLVKRVSFLTSRLKYNRLTTYQLEYKCENCANKNSIPLVPYSWDDKRSSGALYHLVAT